MLALKVIPLCLLNVGLFIGMIKDESYLYMATALLFVTTVVLLIHSKWGEAKQFGKVGEEWRDFALMVVKAMERMVGENKESFLIKAMVVLFAVLMLPLEGFEGALMINAAYAVLFLQKDIKEFKGFKGIKCCK